MRRRVALALGGLLAVGLLGSQRWSQGSSGYASDWVPRSTLQLGTTAVLDAGAAVPDGPDLPEFKVKSTGPKSDYATQLAECRDFACLREVHAAYPPGARREGSRFSFPQFYIIGWQKTATTSLYHFLVEHPQVVRPTEKEPEFFTMECGSDPGACSPEDQATYLNTTIQMPVAAKYDFRKAAFEASTHYSREGPIMATKLREALPWVKVVASLREPISRVLSMLAHNLDNKLFGLEKCGGEPYGCLKRDIREQNYSTPLLAWVQAFPRNQVLLLQYEHLTSSEEAQAASLLDLQLFVGLDPGVVSREAMQLGTFNARKHRVNPEGWAMKREQYEDLVAAAREDATLVAAIVNQFGFGSGQQWISYWEGVWQRNLGTCGRGPNGKCTIQLS